MRKLLIVAILISTCSFVFGQWTNQSYDRLTVSNSTQKLGVGTDWPQERLDIYGEGSNINIQFRNWAETEAGLIWRDQDFQSTEFGKLMWNSGGNNEFDFYINDASTPKMTIKSDGNIGIGTNDPIEKLHIDGNTRIGNQYSSSISLGNANPSSTPWIKSFIGFNLSFNSNTNNWEVWDNANKGTNAIMTTGNRMKFVAIEQGSLLGNTLSQADMEKYIVMSIHNDATLTNPASVILGTAQRDANLYVNGIAKAHEIEVKLTTWADYVFNKDYELSSLQEVEKYIEEHNHLPNVPSEKEVIEHGVNLGEMDAILLQKIEELTLYIIEQDKRIKALEK